jgi:hypothetical protein
MVKADGRKLKPADLQGEMAKRFGVIVKRTTAQRAIAAAAEHDISFDESCRLLPSFVQEFNRLDPGGRAAYVTDDGIFQGAFFMCSGSVTVLRNCRKVLCLDACHLTGYWTEGRIMFAVGLDADNHYVIAAFAIVDSECTRSYQWMLWQMKQHEVMNEILGHEELVIVSDRSKGLINAVRAELPGAWHMHCTRHIVSNVKAHLAQRELPKLAEAAENTIWAAQAAMTAGEFQAAMMRLRQLSEGAADYIEQSNPQCGRLTR